MLQEDFRDIDVTSVEFQDPAPHFDPRSMEVSPKGPSRSSEKAGGARKPGRHRKEIRVHNSVHDRLQLECNLTFDLRPRQENEQVRDFKVDMYLFFPNSVGINSSTFDSTEFFKHTTSYFRVRTPLFPHLKAMDPTELSFESAENYFSEHLSSLARSRLRGKVVEDVKLFGNFLYTELKKLRSSLGKRRGLDENKKAELAKTLFHRTELLWTFRERYLKPIREERYLLDDEVTRAFSLTDEYLSYRLELVLLRATDVLETHKEKINGLLEREIEYRRQSSLLVLGEKGRDTVAFEHYTYRLGLLKKYLGEVLFLQQISNKKDDLYRNYAAAVGAGLAAIFAGLAERQRVQYLTGHDSGLRLTFLVGLAVLAYIFKDRIKDLSKEYFNTRLKERLPDRRFALSHESFTLEGEKRCRNLGTIAEYFRFVKTVPADVGYLRTLGQVKTTDPERREHVVHAGRRLRLGLRSKKHRRQFPLIKNVLRIDISPFLSKLDNPTMPVSFVAEEGGSTTVQAPKVYHLNIVLRYEVGFDTEDGARYVDYERFRLIVNKNGIVRLERIVESGRLGYEAKDS